MQVRGETLGLMTQSSVSVVILSSMIVMSFDNTIITFKGQGVKKDIPRAVTFLKKAVEQVGPNYVLNVIIMHGL